MQSLDTRLSTLFERDDWKQARQLLRMELKKRPDNHWLWTRLSTTYYEDRKYKKALQLSERAMELAPHCPLVLWDYAGSLEMAGFSREAIVIWKRLLRKGVDRIAYGECGEGLRWARSLLNDCRYRIGKAYRELDDVPAANHYLREHLRKRAPGIPSIYPRSEAQARFVSLQKELSALDASSGTSSHRFRGVGAGAVSNARRRTHRDRVRDGAGVDGAVQA